MLTDVTIPDIGDFSDVPVIEIAVAPGDRVAVDTPILMLESDKATLDIPAPVAGVVAELLVAIGDRVSAGSLVMRIETESAAAAPAAAAPAATAPDAAAPAAAPAVTAPAAAVSGQAGSRASLVVIGAGPGGYTAAFRAADLGREVVLIDPRESLGRVCLNVGCIPSKALLHMAKLRGDVEEAAGHGMGFGAPAIDLDALRGFKDGVVARLTGGLAGLARRRKVRVIRGTARFTGPNSLAIEGPEPQALGFEQAIVAVGSEPVRLPFLPEDPRIVDSTGALALPDIPERLLVVGGGIIGLEMAQVYHALGSRIEIVELADQIIPGADRDLVAPLAKRIASLYGAVRTRTRLTAVTAGPRLTASFEGPEGAGTGAYDRILVAVGRVPNGARVAPEAAGIALDGAGFIPVDAQMRTAQPHVFAIGDVVGQPMLAHKAVHEAKVAAEAACGHRVAFEPAGIPSVAYTDPEVAWVGLTETLARERGIAVQKGVFPWAASGRSLSLGRSEGLTKLVFDPETGKLLGAGIVGPGAGELIAEAALAVEMGADAEDIGRTIHPHPTLSETLAFAAEAHAGTLTDL
ncbi:dihydrolipoyl dehydrogenase [Paralimibaculum aggregatum]|uniref:Dihydrolipoyl dehydrogenase n=1 Tax=Paralimibaculum aggregatum TaxID=3036245 RepID=A0ABQ6LGE4_9RHOB|nr:dihydrolipoyl dehydrogenase [Limibaculum sp. NKW23]GMG82380.1 dihydrolipoyl dehydrogenase [Limibaculum sp. NKW23]